MFKKISLLVLLFLFSYFLYFLYNYPFPWFRDYYKNWDQYIEIIDLLNKKYNDKITYIWDISIVFADERCYYKADKECYQNNKEIIDKVLEVGNSYFRKCPNWYIKIIKWWRLNMFFEQVYLYNKDWFENLPSHTKEIINDNIIVYYNYDGRYTSDSYCEVR